MEHERKKTSLSKKLLGALWLAVALFLAYVVIFPPKQKDLKVKQKSEAQQKTREELKALEALKKDSIDHLRWDELDASLNSFNVANYLGDDRTPMNGVGQLQEFAERVNLALQSDDEGLASRAKNWEQKLKALQKDAYPRLRKKWAGDLSKKLWKDDIEVKALGKNATTLEFIGGTFITNRNIAAFQDELALAMKDMRFKRANYKWSTSVDEYQYFTMENKNDDEL
jgi:hypothetical protein